MLRGVLPFAAENDIVEPFLIFVKCSKMILEQINAVRALAKSGGFCYTVSSLLGCGNAREGEKMEQTNKGLSGNQLKLFAMLAMTVDHFTSVIWPDYPRDWWILLLHIIGRMAAPIFWFMVAEGYHYTRTLLAFPGDWSSIAVLAILEIGQNRGDFRRQMTRMMLWVAMYALIYALFIDPVYGILQLFAGLTIPLLKRYNGTRGAGRGMKYLFYLYYPAHLFLCGLVRILLYGNVGVMVGGQ